MFDSLFRLTRPLLILFALLVPPTAYAAEAPVQPAWRLLDYLAVDYPGAVSGGRIVSQAEYAEMREFSASVSRRLAALPPQPERAPVCAVPPPRPPPPPPRPGDAAPGLLGRGGGGGGGGRPGPAPPPPRSSGS